MSSPLVAFFVEICFQFFSLNKIAKEKNHPNHANIRKGFHKVLISFLHDFPRSMYERLLREILRCTAKEHEGMKPLRDRGSVSGDSQGCTYRSQRGPPENGKSRKISPIARGYLWASYHQESLEN